MFYFKIIHTKKQCLFLFIFLSSLLLKGQEKEHLESYDYYSQISKHPRLLLKKNEEIKVIEAIKRNPQFKKIHNYIIKEANSFITLKPLTYKLRANRLLHISRKALTRLYYLSYSYRFTKDKKYLKKAEEELNAVCDFKDWFPNIFIDASEMCMAVAIAYDWLYDDLEEKTKEKARKAILEKAFKPSYNSKYNFFFERHGNWNSVCNASLVFGALAIFDEDSDAAIPVIERALKTTLLPLKVFAPDGNYPEGPQYWNYGATFQVMLSAALKSALGSDKGLSDSPGFTASANYMLFASGPSSKYFNYSDCGEKETAKSSMFWFAQKTNNPSLVFRELELIENGYYTKKSAGNIDRILPNTLIFGKQLDLKNLSKPSQNIYIGNGITPVAIVRTKWKGEDDMYFGIKGGKSSDAHSHMDQGSFVFDIGENRWAMDFGLQSYRTLLTKGVDLWNLKQDSQRWDVFRYNNLNHNTLTINNQRHNVKGKAEIIKSYKSSKKIGAKVDLTSVLNLNNELKSATRTATVIKNNYLKITDCVETNSKAVALRWNMVTKSTAKIIDEKTIKLHQNGKNLFLKFDANIPFKLTIRSSENPKELINEFNHKKYGDYNAKNPGTVMVGFDAKIPPKTKANFKITFKESNK